MEPPPLLRSASLVVACAALLACAPAGPKAGDHGYLGAQACAACHAERWETFRRTSHHLTSQLPTAEAIAGSFASPSNVMPTGNPTLWFEMTAGDDGFRQTVHVREGAKETTRSERIALVLGSGKMGQSYAYWRGSELLELPVSYLRAADRWVNSPGQRYRDGTADFDRPIEPRCLDCHATWVESRPGPSNAYSAEGMVLGVSCERCHGPGAKHVAWHREHPGERVGREIARPADLSRERSLELCGQCHGGGTELLRPAFTYRPGEDLETYVRPPPAQLAPPPGVHSANQLVRLRQSRCFLESDDLTCARCHDPHVAVRDDPSHYSKRCMSCHQPTACGMHSRLGPRIEANCIDCHMPKQEVRSTVFLSPGATSHPRMTEHRIGIDPQATARALPALEQRPK
jgi:hypothetical protein